MDSLKAASLIAQGIEALYGPQEGGEGEGEDTASTPMFRYTDDTWIEIPEMSDSALYGGLKRLEHRAWVDFVELYFLLRSLLDYSHKMPVAMRRVILDMLFKMGAELQWQRFAPPPYSSLVVEANLRDLRSWSLGAPSSGTGWDEVDTPYGVERRL